MRINGEWASGDDGVVRPVIQGRVLTSSGLWTPAPFLVDTGADQTVFSASMLEDLSLQSRAAPDQIGGVGGIVNSVLVETQIQFYRETGSPVVFRGQYRAVTEVEALDISVLGRDILGLFSAIVDQPGNVVCLLGQRHRYTIEQS
jgi:predicted aspartyl protease